MKANIGTLFAWLFTKTEIQRVIEVSGLQNRFLKESTMPSINTFTMPLTNAAGNPSEVADQISYVDANGNPIPGLNPANVTIDADGDSVCSIEYDDTTGIATFTAVSVGTITGTVTDSATEFTAPFTGTVTSTPPPPPAGLANFFGTPQ